MDFDVLEILGILFVSSIVLSYLIFKKDGKKKN